jgi:uncharacterized SAM-binding protein YcdF (DUF218 family)
MTYIQAVLTALLTGLVLVTVVGRGKRYRTVGVGLAVALALWSWNPVAWLSSGTLEWWYPVRPLPAANADAIVVLAAGTARRDASQPEDEPRESTYLRCAYASWLYQHWRALPVVASGGAMEQAGPSHAAVMAKVLAEQGVPPAMIWLEDRSRSTYENAVYSAGLLRAKGIRRIALVTEAQHMLRAEACFRRQGMEVLPAPCCYRTLQFHGHWTWFFPDARAIAYNEDNAHEWAGLAWYKLSGKI